MSYQIPVSGGWVTSDWADHKNRKPRPSGEPGTDWAANYGTPVVAASSGRVVDTKGTNSGAMGRYVTIDLDDGRRVRYLHLSALSVSTGARVSRGQKIGALGGSAWGGDRGVGSHVHVTLFPSHAYNFGATLDFERYVGGAPSGGGSSSPSKKDVLARQTWLNNYYGLKLVLDGELGPKTREAIVRYQKELKVTPDGVWGPATQAAHQKVYDAWVAKQKPKPAPAPKPKPKPSTSYPKVSVANVSKIGDIRGLQKIARLNGYKGAIDGIWGPGSQAGFKRFLDASYGGSIVTWLKKRWGYSGNDQLGPVMTAALKKANDANLRDL